MCLVLSRSWIYPLSRRSVSENRGPLSGFFSWDCSGNQLIKFRPLIFWRSNKKAQADLATALSVLDGHLKGKSFVVNDQITLADITIACTLVYPFKFVCDKKFLKPYGNVVRWFQACVTEPEFAAVVGKVEMCKTPLKAGQ